MGPENEPAPSAAQSRSACAALDPHLDDEGDLQRAAPPRTTRNAVPLRFGIKELFGLVDGRVDVVDKIITEGRLGAIDVKGDTALHICASRGRLQLCDRLITGGADVMVRNFDQKTAADRAEENGHDLVAQLLRSLMPPATPQDRAEPVRAAPMRAKLTPQHVAPDVAEELDLDELDFDFIPLNEAMEHHKGLDFGFHETEFTPFEGRIEHFGTEDGAKLDLSALDLSDFQIEAGDLLPVTDFSKWPAAEHAGTVTRRRGRPRHEAVEPLSAEHAISLECCREWVELILKKERCQEDDLAELVAMIEGDFDATALHANLLRSLEDFGFPFEESQEEGLQPWPDLDREELAEHLHALCSGGNGRPWMGVPHLTRTEEASFFRVMHSAREAIARALTDDLRLTSAVLMLAEGVLAGRIEYDLVTEHDLSRDGASAQRQRFEDSVLRLREHAQRTSESAPSDAVAAMMELRLSETGLEVITAGISGEADLAPVAIAIQAAAARHADAVARLIHAHLPFLQRRVQRLVSDDAELEDAFQAGYAGLKRAIDGFDPDRGYRLMTYAQFHVRNAVKRAHRETGHLIRLPVHAAERLERGRNALEYYPLDAEKAEREAILRRTADMELDAFARLDAMQDGFDHFDEEIHTSDNFEPTPFEVIASRQAKEAVQRMLDLLPERARMIVEMRFGFGEFEEHTLERCAAVFGVTRERIRQIEAKALRHLMHPARSRALREHM